MVNHVSDLERARRAAYDAVKAYNDLCQKLDERLVLERHQPFCRCGECWYNLGSAERCKVQEEKCKSRRGGDPDPHVWRKAETLWDDEIAKHRNGYEIRRCIACGLRRAVQV